MRFASASSGTSSAPSPSYVIVQLWDEDSVDSGLTITLSSRKIDNARPTTSNPGPMFAEEQGTLILNLRILVVESRYSSPSPSPIPSLSVQRPPTFEEKVGLKIP